MKFLAQPTVREREVYVDLPVQINAEITQRFTPESLQEAFNEPRTLILVAGEGGAGKTSIACQIGKWAAASSESSGLCDHLLLPLLIEGDIILRTDRANEQFQQTVRGVLRDLLNDNEPPSNEMLMSLLKHKRILVIVDGFSEMSDAGQSTIQPVDPTFPANALLITSRSLEHFSETGRTTINPQRLEKSSLVTFMERYLEKRGKLELLSNQEFQDQAASLQRLVGGRKITPLFARLYIDLSVAAKEGADESSLPKTVPDLVLEYLNLLNRKIVSARKEDYEVHRLARIVAGKCVMPNLRPTPARISDVLSALGDGLDAGNDLTYLEKRLGLLQTSRFGEEVHFTLDPLAEYLAAIGLVEEYKDNKDMWREFLDLVDNTPGAPSVVSGFLEAVSDCYLREYPTGPEDFIVREIHVRRDSSL